MGNQQQKDRAAMARRQILRAAGALAALPAAARAEWLRDEVVVYADPALRPVMDALGPHFTQAQRVRCFCAPPAQMVALLAHNTQDDVLLTEAAAIAEAQQSGLVMSPTPRLWRNRLVFAVTGAGAAAIDFNAAALMAACAGGKLAVPDATDACPIDGPALLQKLGVAEKLAGRTLGAADTDDALATLLRGEAAVALCHATQAAANPEIRILMRIPDDAYAAIFYQAALSHAAWSRYNAQFMEFLTKASAPLARRFGLEVLA